MSNERKILFGIIIFFIIGISSICIQYVQHKEEVSKITILARGYEIATLEEKVEVLTTTDGYIVPENEFLVFPFYPNDQVFVTSQFHLRGDPFQDNTGPNMPDERLHKAVDLVSWKNTITRAPVSGYVVEHFPPPNGYWKGDGAYGGKVVIQDANGVFHGFSHLSETYVSSVEGKNYVEAGDEVGRMGNTGKSTGGHLHYEIYSIDDLGVTTWYDPLMYFDIRVIADGQVMFLEENMEVLTIQG